MSQRTGFEIQQAAALVESSNDAIVGYTLDGVVITWNTAAERLFGYTLEDFRGRGIAVLVPPDRIGEYDRVIARVRRGERVERFETARVRKDGRLVEVSLTISPIRATDGRIIGASKIAHDITDRKAAEEESRVLREAMEHAIEGISLLTPDWRYRSVNRTYAQATGYTPTQLLGMDAQLTIHPDDLPKAAAANDLMRATGKAEVELRGLRRDGTEYIKSVVMVAARDRHGGYIGHYCFMRDITDRKRSEALERERASLRDAVSAMDKVLGVVGHELRTPLAALRAMGEFLLTDGARDTPEGEHFLRAMNDEIHRMSETVNNLLEAARLNSGHARWNWSQFELADAVEDAFDTFRPLMSNSTVALTFGVDPPDLSMNGDAGAIRRLIQNLVSNAVKNTTEGHIDVAVRAETTPRARWVEIRVTDTGAGIPPEVVTRLGDAFALNAGVVGSDHARGTGLGLAICREIASAHGGMIQVLSTPGRGTTITTRVRSDLEEPQTRSTKPVPDRAA
jgi:PAS domain S-box-containing protein